MPFIVGRALGQDSIHHDVPGVHLGWLSAQVSFHDSCTGSWQVMVTGTSAVRVLTHFLWVIGCMCLCLFQSHSLDSLPPSFALRCGADIPRITSALLFRKVGSGKSRASTSPSASITDSSSYITTGDGEAERGGLWSKFRRFFGVLMRF